jgi:hypothetical protein
VSKILDTESSKPDTHGEVAMALSFQEKSLWLMLVSLVGCFGFYFAMVLPPGETYIRPEQVVLFAVAVGFLVVVQIVGHAVIAILDRRTETDERDRLIALKGSRYASYVLGTGVCCALWLAVITVGNFLFTHVLLAFWVLAELVGIAAQLVLHRRGA